MSDERLKSVKLIQTIFKNYGLTTWIQDGTLLGLYRDGKIIEWDHDQDLGIYEYTEEQVVNAAKEVLQQEGFDLKGLRIVNGRIDVIKFRKDNFTTDLFFYTELNKNIFYHSAHGPGGRHDYLYKKFSTKDIEFNGYTFNSPENPLEFIVCKYGENWNTPTKKWCNIRGPKNRVNSKTRASNSDKLKEEYLKGKIV